MNHLMNVGSLSSEERQVLMQQLLVAQMSDFKRELENLKSEVVHASESTAIRQDEFANELEKTKAIALNAQRVQEPKFEWVNQGDFGRFFNPTIGAGYMGKFLKAVGLAMPGKGMTTPYRRYIGRYAEVVAREHFTQTRWHYKNCMEYIDEWLKENGIFEEFYSLQTIKDVEKFINSL